MLISKNHFLILNLIQLVLTTNSSFNGKQNENIEEISFFQILNDQNQTNKILQSTNKSNDNYQEIVFNGIDNLNDYNKTKGTYSNAGNDSFYYYHNNINNNNIIDDISTKDRSYSETSLSPFSSSLSSISFLSNEIYFKLNTSVYDDEYSDYHFLNDEKLENFSDKENTTKNTISISSLLNLHFENFLAKKKNKLVDLFRIIKQSGNNIFTHKNFRYYRDYLKLHFNFKGYENYVYIAFGISVICLVAFVLFSIMCLLK
jgi:hypothetical protein